MLVQAVLQSIAAALSTYTRRNLGITYEALALLARGTGGALAQPELARLYMGPLLAKMGALSDTDKVRITQTQGDCR